MRRLGLIDHVSRFNQRHGYREGRVFSNEFANALEKLASLTTSPDFSHSWLCPP